MALYENKKYYRCDCGNDQFEEVNIFRIEEAQISSTLSKTIKYKKENLGEFIKCLSCKKILKNPIEN